MRNRMLLSLAALVVCAGLMGAGEAPVVAAPAAGNSILEKYAATIGAILPSGWSVRMDVGNGRDGLWLERKELAAMKNIAPNGPANAEPEMKKPALFLVVTGPVS